MRYFNPIGSGKYRNMVCVCGSGKKIKKCHGSKHSVTKEEREDIIRMVNEFNVNFNTEFAKQAEKALEATNEQKQEETKNT